MDRDFGSKPGSGGVAEEQWTNRDRRERLYRLALEVVDLKKDPWFFRNHLGQIVCKLCGTLHMNEASYLAHTQGKRHKTNTGIYESQKKKEQPAVVAPVVKKVVPRKTIKIGRPGYRVLKQRSPEGQKSLLFRIQYPEIAEGIQPRHRFMSAFEQKVEAPDRNYQYLLFAAEPYETIAFKIPNLEIDKGEGKFYTNWDRENLIFTLQLFFKEKKKEEVSAASQQQQQRAIGGPTATVQPPPPPPPAFGGENSWIHTL